MAEESSNIEYKLVIVGGEGTGKGELALYFVQNYFVEGYDPTIEDSYRKQCFIDGETALLDILDTAGQEEYSSMRDQYMWNGEGFLLLYSIVDKNSFNEIHKYHEQILRIKDKPDIPMILVATKAEQEADRVVSYQEGEELAKHLNIGYVEVSAKNRINVDKAFYDLVRAIREYRKSHNSETPEKERSSNKCTIQ